MTTAPRQPHRRRSGASGNSAQAPLEVAALLARAHEARRQQAQRPVVESEEIANDEPTLPWAEDEPGFISGTLTEAVPVTHGGRTCRVRRGDTVLSVAKAHGVSVPALIELNDLQGRVALRAGQILSLPQKNVTPPPASHRVQAGDTLESIAARYGTTAEAIRRANAMGSDLIRVGELLMLDGSGAMSSRSDVPAPEKLPQFSSAALPARLPEPVVRAAQINRHLLNRRVSPRREWVHRTISRLAGEIGVDTPLALAIAMQESGFRHRTVSPVNAIGIMQVTPRAGQWAASLAGRPLDILDPADNIVAGLTILNHLIVTTGSVPGALAAYYQGAASVERNGMSADTRTFVRMVQVLAARYERDSAS